MSCSCLINALERLGLYEPQINLQKAVTRLEKERSSWKKNVRDRNEFWKDFENRPKLNKLPSYVERAIDSLSERGVRKVAVDLGCGISSTTFKLLERGWTVYAVDNSSLVLEALKQKVSQMKKKWIQEKQLILVNASIEKFEYREKAHLIMANDALPYCDPIEIQNIFSKAKKALFSQGVLVCNLFPHNGLLHDWVIKSQFGAWLTTKNIVEALMKSMHFSSCSVTEGRNLSGQKKQFHVVAVA